ncbi:MAG: ATP-binding protein, partial [Persicimonas sp.]
NSDDLDLSACAEEPIHIPGAIQPHGILLALTDADLEIVQVSENVEDLLGRTCRELLGERLERLFVEPGAERLRSQLRAPRLDYSAALAVAVELEPAGRIWFDAICHRHQGLVIVELENARTSREDEAVGSQAGALHARLLGSVFGELGDAAGLEQMCSYVAQQVREVTGFDRVMLYRFHEDMHGEVIAEARAEGMDSFLGLHYPASDIPEQARRLYRLNWLRLIADVDYVPARLVPAENPCTGATLDMSHSELRSVSPVHLQYLENMGVGASMSISLLEGDRLWGLIACHHRSPKFVPHAVRSACELLGVMLSLQLATHEFTEETLRRGRLQTLHAELLRSVAEHRSILGMAEDRHDALLDFADATGAVVQFDGERRAVGDTPDDGFIDGLIDWLCDRADDGVWHTDQLSAEYAPASRVAEVASGLLAILLSPTSGDVVLFFRPEVVRTVDWAGNPRKPVERTDGGDKLTPRESFERWKETVCDEATPFSEAEIESARRLRSSLLTHIVERAQEIARLNKELEQRSEELESFAYVASHDLKEPLRSLKGHAQYLDREHGENLDERAQSRVQGMVQLTERMASLLDSLLHYSKVSTADIDREPVDLNEVLEEALEILDKRRRESGAAIRVPRPLPAVGGVRSRVREVFVNLIGNALKYNDKPDAFVEIGYQTPREHGEGGPTRFYVRDNGIGIKERYHERIFELFRRLHPRDAYGGGTGAGLTIVERIVERHGGRIWVHSTPGEGTTFYFTLEPGSPDG